jgi:signal transduction histidine kinase
MAERIHPQTSADSQPNRTEMQLRLVVETGLLLASERSLDVIVQAALDAGLKLSGAAFGAFFYNKFGEDGERYQLYEVAGIDPKAFASFPLPRPTQIFAYTFEGKGILRSDNITLDPRYGHNAPHKGMPKGHVPVCSYLAVPVQSRGGEILGALFYGHPEPAQFDPSCEDLVATVAAQAAVAMENARLTETISREIVIADQARQLQRDTADHLRQALDAGQLGTWTWDRTTDLLDFDDRAAEIFAVKPHSPITRTEMRARTVLGEDLQATPDDLRDQLAAGGTYSAEYRIQVPGAGIRWIAAKGIGTHAPGTQELTGMSGTVQDITARKTQEAALRQSEKLAATGRLAAAIAHEINNPLEAVTNLIFLCKTDPTVPATIQRLLETADNELARVAQIAQQTLGFYRDTTRPTEIDVAALLTGVVDLFSRKLLSKKLVCTLDVARDLRIIGLQGEIKQVFSNLLVNAIDASGSNSTIRIRGKLAAREGRQGVSVLMADQGSGIPEHVRSRIFSPFFTTKQSTGTGLGLWVTRGIVEKQGGCICFRTRAECEPTGTIFRVFLPKELSKIESFGAPKTGFLQ